MKLRVIAALAAASIASASSAGAETYLYGTYLPSTHDGTEVMQAFFDDLNRESSSMKWEMHVAGAMGGARDLLAGVRDGIVHGGHIVDVYTPSELPRSNVIAQLALISLESLAGTAAANETLLVDCASCLDEMRDQGVVPLAYYSTTPQVLMCNREVDGLSALQNQKVRSVGPIGVAYKNLGAVPVNTAMTELYDALQRGQVDCASGAEAWLKDMRLNEVVEAVYDYPFATYISSMPFNMNAEAWDGLSDADKQLIANRLPGLSADWAYVYVDEQLAARDAAQAAGVEYRKMPDDIIAAVEAYRTQERERVVAWGQGRGIDDAEQIVATFMENLDKWEGLMTEIGEDRAAYKAALDREIFSKLAM